MTEPTEEAPDEGTPVFQVLLGFRPFVLIEVTGVDENGFPEIELHAGGGIPPERVSEFLRDIAEDLDDPAQTSSQS